MESTEQLILDVRKALEHESNTEKYRLLMRILALLLSISTEMCKICGLSQENDIHYVGTVDSHMFVSKEGSNG